MSRWLLLLIVVIIAISPGLAFLYLSSPRAVSSEARNQREAIYQSALRAYSQSLTPGMTRKAVEKYLHGKKVEFRQICCMEQSGAFSDLVKIGQDEHPWFCSENDVYIALEFTPPAVALKAADIGVLRNISIFHALEGCLSRFTAKLQMPGLA